MFKNFFKKFKNEDKDENKEVYKEEEIIDALKDEELIDGNNDENINDKFSNNPDFKEQKEEKNLQDKSDTIEENTVNNFNNGNKENINNQYLESNNKSIKDSKENLEVDIKENIVDKEKENNKEKKGFFKSFFDGLTKTRDNISKKIDSVLGAFTKIDEDLFEAIEDTLILSDIGAETTIKIVEKLRENVKLKRIENPELIKKELNEVLKEVMKKDSIDNSVDISSTPLILLIVGVNGVGKTTTIGKLAKRYKLSGKSVMLAAADTFRAAAIDQLGEWSKRAGVEMIAHSEGSDPAAVVYDAIDAARNRNIDILIVDTAGRLHNKKNLMNELNKIHRVIEKNTYAKKVETYIVLDATTGQNAMNQAKEFSEAADISGVIITKMDGTAKGGFAIRLQSEMDLPIKYIGLGEKEDDLKEFNTDDFIDSII
ncbi:signal recognition particle-docking protein FtsY [Citroniella saccharovorans]|uniref:Signal recognition particle receptor FtsY n=1 Tax=Citroniella saccharovorans TaxID=2053367 RepID=A0AAW9MQ16_9FIRM|nr:signal recognition particle-docking protein FtsY [Citroniella saccharovorans]MEB3429653.1 signal recognition particle-docking protein FtsY [Citroniella saccharovorans]